MADREVMPFMKCGHQANSYRVRGDERTPACVICAGLNPGAYEVFGAMDELLADRVAACGADRHGQRPSTDALEGRLAFFEYRGPGSRIAIDSCGKCGFTRSAHDGERKPGARVCASFVERGPLDTDTYYCGCRGWD